MTIFLYDGTFEGFLSAVFAAYAQRCPDALLHARTASVGTLFGETVEVETCAARAGRVRAGIRRVGGDEAYALLYHAFLSERRGVGAQLWHYLRLLFGQGHRAAENVLSGPASSLHAAAAATRREVHRMHAFVRFECRRDGGWEAAIAPECNVLPLLGPHFGERYAAMRWAIVDTRRGQALVHEAGKLQLVEGAAAGERAAEEATWQKLWAAYYHAVNIPERENLRLRQRHVPRRYWHHMTELRGA